MLPYDTLETEHICASDSELEVWVSAYTSVSVEFHVGAPLSALGGGGGATPQKGHTQLGFVHEAASVGLSTRGLMRIWAHTCVGMPVGLCAHLVNTEANLL